MKRTKSMSLYTLLDCARTMSRVFVIFFSCLDAVLLPSSYLVTLYYVYNDEATWQPQPTPTPATPHQSHRHLDYPLNDDE